MSILDNGTGTVTNLHGRSGEVQPTYVLTAIVGIINNNNEPIRSRLPDEASPE